MPRLSLWRENHSSDYKFIDRRISEMFTIGGTGIIVHKYLGVDTSGNDGTDATKPAYASQSALNIQDLLFLENRDRKYDTAIYKLRGIYQKQDQDFDLTQFGIFLAQGTQFMTFHLNDMIETIGRKLVAGDVLELMHLKEFYSLDQSVPFAIKRFFVVTDAANAAEGYSPTWWPHLWRVKLQPMVDSQEYKDILNQIASDDPFEANANAASLGSVVSTYEKYLDINQSIIAQAEIEVPQSGYNTANLYTVGRSVTGQLGDPKGTTVAVGNVDITGVTTVNLTATSTRINSNRILVSNALPAVVGAIVSTPNLTVANAVTVVSIVGKNGLVLSSNTTIANNEPVTLHINTSYVKTSADSGTLNPGAKIKGYMSGDGTPPNSSGMEVNMGIAFPDGAKSGDYFLRLDFVPNRLFRFDGKRWVKIEDAVRTSLTPGSPNNKTQREGFVNNNETFVDSQGTTRHERVSLSKALTPKADN